MKACCGAARRRSTKGPVMTDADPRFDEAVARGLLTAAALPIRPDRLPALAAQAADLNAKLRAMTARGDLGETPPAHRFDAGWE